MTGSVVILCQLLRKCFSFPAKGICGISFHEKIFFLSLYVHFGSPRGSEVILETMLLKNLNLRPRWNVPYLLGDVARTAFD